MLVAANMTGEEKQGFKYVKSLAVYYNFNNTAWTTPQLFENIIRGWDKKLFEKKKEHYWS